MGVGVTGDCVPVCVCVRERDYMNPLNICVSTIPKYSLYLLQVPAYHCTVTVNFTSL